MWIVCFAALICFGIALVLCVAMRLGWHYPNETKLTVCGFDCGRIPEAEKVFGIVGGLIIVSVLLRLGEILLGMAAVLWALLILV